MAVLDLGKVVPEKGTDYFTEADISSIVADVKNDIKVSDLDNDAGYITKSVNDLTYYTLATGTGHTIDLSINSSTYVLTLDLKNSAGTVISTDSIDLPLESVVVNGSYDSTNKKIILTLQSGNTIEIPVGDLVSGLQSEITSQSKLSSDLVDDTDKTNKFVTASEKTTWSGKYDKPSGGIPSTDLSSAVQTSLGKADTAIQDISGKQDVLTAGENISIVNNVISATGGTPDLSNYYTKAQTNANFMPIVYLSYNNNADLSAPTYNSWTTNNLNFSVSDDTRNLLIAYMTAGTKFLVCITNWVNSPSAPSGHYMGGNLILHPVEFSSSEVRFVGEQQTYYGDGKTKLIGEFTLRSLDSQIISSRVLNYSYRASRSLDLYDNVSYTPTSDYNPATKKYVDDAISTAITSALGGSY